MKNTKLRYLVNFAVLALLFAAVAVMGLLGGNTVKLKITPSIWQCSYLIIMAASLNLVLGFLGQLSLGHCGFMAVGAYTAALISLAFQRAGVYTEKSGPAFLLVLLLSILAAGAAAALLGLLVGIPALRLKGDYLAIITLGFGMIIVNLINNLPFCGQQGLSQGAASSSLYATGLGFSNDEKMKYLWVAALSIINASHMLREIGCADDADGILTAAANALLHIVFDFDMAAIIAITAYHAGAVGPAGDLHVLPVLSLASLRFHLLGALLVGISLTGGVAGAERDRKAADAVWTVLAFIGTAQQWIVIFRAVIDTLKRSIAAGKVPAEITFAIDQKAAWSFPYKLQ